METVSRDTFFKVIGPMDVHPRPGDMKGRFFTSQWETPNRTVVGISISDSHLAEPTEYRLASHLLAPAHFG